MTNAVPLSYMRTSPALYPQDLVINLGDSRTSGAKLMLCVGLPWLLFDVLGHQDLVRAERVIASSADSSSSIQGGPSVFSLCFRQRNVFEFISESLNR